MAFFKFRSSGSQGNEARASHANAAPAESVEVMRRRARHRLLGAAVLVLIGVIGFPLLFDTQPRPVPVNIPIDIPDRANPGTPARASTAPATTSSESSTGAKPAVDGVITERADGTEVAETSAPSRSLPPDTPPESKPASKPAEPAPERRPERKPEVAKPESKPTTQAEAKPERKPEAAKPESRPSAQTETQPERKPESPKPNADDGARAQALLEGRSDASSKPAAAASEGRFVVQVGAFSDAAKVREVRQKLEKAGLKTYTTTAKTTDGERTRVRLGPFASRAEADRAASRAKELSLQAAVLAL